MYVAGDAIPLGEDCIELTLGTEETEAKREEDEGGGEGDEEEIEPDGLVEMRTELESEGDAGRIPDTVVVGRLHAEGVVARRDAGVIGGAARDGIGPLVIKAFEHVAVADLLRRSKAEAGVVELEVVVAGGNLQIATVQCLINVV